MDERALKQKTKQFVKLDRKLNGTFVADLKVALATDMHEEAQVALVLRAISRHNERRKAAIAGRNIESGQWAAALASKLYHFAVGLATGRKGK